jgi:zinc protease
VDFHRNRIRPGGLSLAIVGDVHPELALEQAALEFDDWIAPAPEHVSVSPPPAAVYRRQHVVEMPGKAQTDIAYGFTTIRRLDPRYYTYWMLNNILGQFGLGGRLADNIRERQGMAYYAFSVFQPNVAEGPLVVRAGVDPSNVERAIQAIDDEVGRLAREGPTADELAETRESLIGSIARMLETNQSIAVFLQTAEQFGLGLDYHQRLPGFLRAVTMDDVKRAAADVLRPDRASIGIAGPPSTGQHGR